MSLPSDVTLTVILLASFISFCISTSSSSSPLSSAVDIPANVKRATTIISLLPRSSAPQERQSLLAYIHRRPATAANAAEQRSRMVIVPHALSAPAAMLDADQIKAVRQLRQLRRNQRHKLMTTTTTEMPYTTLVDNGQLTTLASRVVSQQQQQDVDAAAWAAQVDRVVSQACYPDMYGTQPHPFSCNRFVQCFAGRGVEQQCPPGTQFDDTARVCNWPDGRSRSVCSADKLSTYRALIAEYTWRHQIDALGSSDQQQQLEDGQQAEGKAPLFGDGNAVPLKADSPSTTAVRITAPDPGTTANKQQFDAAEQLWLMPQAAASPSLTVTDQRHLQVPAANGAAMSEDRAAEERTILSSSADGGGGGAGFDGGSAAADMLTRFATRDLVFECPVSDGYFAIERDCSLYMRCTNGVAGLYACPMPLVFDPAGQRCRSAVDELIDLNHCRLRKKFSCPGQGGLFRDASDPRAFYNCWNYRWHRQFCPNDLWFNERLQWCDYQTNVIGDLMQAGSDADTGILLGEITASHAVDTAVTTTNLGAPNSDGLSAMMHKIKEHKIEMMPQQQRVPLPPELVEDNNVRPPPVPSVPPVPPVRRINTLPQVTTHNYGQQHPPPPLMPPIRRIKTNNMGGRPYFRAQRPAQTAAQQVFNAYYVDTPEHDSLRRQMEDVIINRRQQQHHRIQSSPPLQNTYFQAPNNFQQQRPAAANGAAAWKLPINRETNDIINSGKNLLMGTAAFSDTIEQRPPLVVNEAAQPNPRRLILNNNNNNNSVIQQRPKLQPPFLLRNVVAPPIVLKNTGAMKRPFLPSKHPQTEQAPAAAQADVHAQPQNPVDEGGRDQQQWSLAEQQQGEHNIAPPLTTAAVDRRDVSEFLSSFPPKRQPSDAVAVEVLVGPTDNSSANKTVTTNDDKILFAKPMNNRQPFGLNNNDKQPVSWTMAAAASAPRNTVMKPFSANHIRRKLPFITRININSSGNRNTPSPSSSTTPHSVELPAYDEWKAIKLAHTNALRRQPPLAVVLPSRDLSAGGITNQMVMTAEKVDKNLENGLLLPTTANANNKQFFTAPKFLPESHDTQLLPIPPDGSGHDVDARVDSSSVLLEAANSNNNNISALISAQFDAALETVLPQEIQQNPTTTTSDVIVTVLKQQRSAAKNEPRRFDEGVPVDGQENRDSTLMGEAGVSVVSDSNVVVINMSSSDVGQRAAFLPETLLHFENVSSDSTTNNNDTVKDDKTDLPPPPPKDIIQFKIGSAITRRTPLTTTTNAKLAADGDEQQKRLQGYELHSLTTTEKTSYDKPTARTIYTTAQQQPPASFYPHLSSLQDDDDGVAGEMGKRRKIHKFAEPFRQLNETPPPTAE